MFIIFEFLGSIFFWVVLAILAILIFLMARYRIGKPDEALIVTGSFLGKEGIKILRNSGTFVIPKKKSTEKKSAFVLRSVTPKLCSSKKASSTEAAPMTVNVMKIERHPFASVCHPPITGPMAGATLIAMPTVPMANPRRESG